MFLVGTSMGQKYIQRQTSATVSLKGILLLQMQVRSLTMESIAVKLRTVME